MYDAIVLAGGTARRLDGADKMAQRVDGVRLLDRVVEAVAGAARIVVVGPPRDVPRRVVWCREDPPGGGPAAAVATGVANTSADTLVILAADLPWIAPAVPALLTALEGWDTAALVDDAERVNHLAAAWRRSALLDALGAIGDPGGAAMRSLPARRTLVPDPLGWGQDCDTWDDLLAARERHR